MPARTLTNAMIDRAATPKTVAVTAVAAPARPDPTCGVPLAPSTFTGTPRNRLVVVGDSLSHGFKSGAVHDTHISWPAIVAWEMGIDSTFRRPTYDGYGGLPLNIEWMLHELESRYGDRINWWETAPAAFSIRHLMDEIEDWWERGKGSLTPKIDGIVHNLSVYGWDLRDALSYTATFAASRIAAAAPRDQYWAQIVDCARERAALRVLDSARTKAGQPLTPLDAAQTLGDQGTFEGPNPGRKDGPGIEVLAVVLGANNVLATVLELGRPKWSGEGYDDLVKKNEFNVWRPEHFAAELKQVVARIRSIKARHVILSTVPHVTIAPIARGVGTKYEPGSRYFPYYTRVWIADGQFNPKDDPHLTSVEARAIDSAIDQYNQAIEDAVVAARKRGESWFLFDMCGLLDRLASRRYVDDPAARPEWWTPYELPPDLAALTPVPNTRFFRADATGRTDGGIFSLDGVHPTTVGYGIVAQEIINIMQLAGVKFYFGDDQTAERPGRVAVDFRRLLKLDTLMLDPPRSLSSTLELIGWIDQHLGVFVRMMSGQ